MRDLLVLISATVALIGSAPATAQTPDGETPAVETVCDPLVDATPGLYGLCVAYCEAHDADLLEELDVPNQNILRNYNHLKSDSDPAMPCLQEVGDCPCWTPEYLATISPPMTNFDANFAHACYNSDSPKQALLESIVNGLDVGGKFNEPAIQLITGISSEGPLVCEIINVGYDEGPPRIGKPINADEFQSCKALLAARAYAEKIAGTVWDCF